jgi:hypothetical protein
MAAVTDKLGQVILMGFLNGDIPLPGFPMEIFEIPKPFLDPKLMQMAAAATQRFENGISSIEVFYVHRATRRATHWGRAKIIRPAEV